MLFWAPRLMLLFASLTHDERCPTLILTYTVSDVTVILLCFQVAKYVYTISDNERPKEIINDTNITQNGLKLVSIWDTTLFARRLQLST